MSADDLLRRLEGVRKTGRDRWTAKCPAHGDKHPSLSIRETDDGLVLLHDFGGCSVEEILDAVGLDFDALFPERATDHHRPAEKKPYSVRDLVLALGFELHVATIILCDVSAGKPLSDEDRTRAQTAARRIVKFIAELHHAR